MGWWTWGWPPRACPAWARGSRCSAGADRQPLGPARHRGAGRRLAGVVRPGKRFRRRQRHPQRRRPAVRLRHLGRPGPRRRWRIEPGPPAVHRPAIRGQLEIASWRDMGMGALFKASDNYRVNNLVNYLSPEFSGWQWGGLRLRRRKRRHRAVRPQPGFQHRSQVRGWPAAGRLHLGQAQPPRHVGNRRPLAASLAGRFHVRFRGAQDGASLVAPAQRFRGPERWRPDRPGPGAVRPWWRHQCMAAGSGSARARQWRMAGAGLHGPPRLALGQWPAGKQGLCRDAGLSPGSFRAHQPLCLWRVYERLRSGRPFASDVGRATRFGVE